MDSRLIIRPACLADCETIVEFNTQLAYETEGKRLIPETISEGVRTLLTDSRHGRYFVAWLGSQIVGQMMHTREWSDWRNGEIWWMQSVFVRPEHRRMGVFRTLYRHLEQLAEQSLNVVGIRLYVERHNARAIDTYQKLGLADAEYMVMERMFGKSFE